LHARPEGARLAAAAFSADPLVARYALGRLVREPVRAAGFELAEIQRLRDDDGRIPEVRALAARLLAIREGGGVAFDREYDWIVATLLAAHPSDYREVGPLVGRLIEFDARRIETARFVARLATAANTPEAVRIAAYGAFDDRRLLRPEDPDEGTQVIFDACVHLLGDSSPLMHGVGALFLSRTIRVLPPSRRAPFASVALTSLRAAPVAEMDEATRSQLRWAYDAIAAVSDVADRIRERK
jgi:hypothetical protein